MIGRSDERWGEVPLALVIPREGYPLTPEELIQYARDHMAHFKAPRYLVVVDTIGRAPNGKVDYKRLKGVAMEHVGAR